MNKNLVIIMLLAVVIFFCSFFVIPEYMLFGQLSNQLGGKIAELDPSNEYYAQIKESYGYIVKNKESLQKIDNALPDKPDLSEVIYFLQQKSTQHGLTVKNVILSGASSRPQNQNIKTVKDIIVSISVFGTYDQLNKFIVSLEKSDRIFEITNVSFIASNTIVSPGGSSATAIIQQPSFDFNIQVKTHSY